MYTFGGKTYLQLKGGPIGLRFTACLASAIMKIWDDAWLKLLRNNGIKPLIYKRYVDDSRNLLKPISEGWRWKNGSFKFDIDEYKNDKKNQSSKADQIRTREELTAISGGS